MGEQVAARSFGGIAQLGEHLPCKQGVKGSNPFISTKAMKRAHAAGFRGRGCGKFTYRQTRARKTVRAFEECP